MQRLAITWLGHSTFLVRTPGGRAVLFDPWLGQPVVSGGLKKPPQADLILVSHGHADHMDDAVAVRARTGARSWPRSSCATGWGARACSTWSR